MDQADVVRALESLGRTMRLVALNMDTGMPVPTEILIRTLESQRDLINRVLPHIPRNDLLVLSTRLGQATEDLIAADFPEVPDFPPNWSTDATD
jgi:hypothetical protein